MDWVGLLFVTCLGLAFCAGVYKVAQDPRWWIGMIVYAFRFAWPTIRKNVLILVAMLLAPETPEDRKRRQEAERRGEDWNPITKRPRER